MRRFLLILFCLYGSVANSQDLVGSGRALNFDGYDDFIDLGNIYDNLSLPVSISAWIFLDPNESNWAPIFTSQDNSPIYNGFWFIVQPTRISVGYGDGLGENTPEFRRSKTKNNLLNLANRWVHVAAVIRGAIDMEIYVNGVNVGGEYSGSSDMVMSSSVFDIAKIGYWFSNNTISRFKGKIDKVVLWNKSLTENEVRSAMCTKQPIHSSGLIGYWTFNEINGNTIIDSSPNLFNGFLIGNPSRIFSGAPIGDESIMTYLPNLGTTSISMIGEGNKLTLSNIRGNPEGIHLYKVNSIPSQVGGLDQKATSKPYFGAFIASLDADNLVEVSQSFQDNVLCNLFLREDNNKASWVSMSNPILDVKQRGEFLGGSYSNIKVDLGPDQIYCDQSSKVLSIDVSDPFTSIKWNTGATTNSIAVSQSGKYWVKATTLCGVISDTIRLQFLKIPAPFSFGEDKELCPFVSKILQPYIDSSGLEFEWQDGSKNASFIAKDYGMYWVKVKNVCGEAVDTVSFFKSRSTLEDVPNVITPNGDFQNQYFRLDVEPQDSVSLLVLNRWGQRVFYSEDYKNDWDGGDVSSGIYFISISNSCIKDTKGTLTIIK